MAIQGECISAEKRAEVWISELASASCAIATANREVLLDGDLSLWIGAIGPLAVTARRLDDARMFAQFKEPLDPRILEHFSYGE